MEAGLVWLKSRGAPRVMLWTAEPNLRRSNCSPGWGFGAPWSR